jgi:PAS domain S-box-containing protein
MKLPSQVELERRLTVAHDALEAAARLGEARFLEAFQNPPSGVGMHEIDLEHKIRRVNPEELRILKYSASDMVGHPAWDFIVMQEASRRAIQRKFAPDQELKPFVRTFRRSDGVGVTMLLMDRRLTDRLGQVTGLRTAMIEMPANA